MTFVAANEAFNGAVRAYSDAFDIVFNGDHSEEALLQLVLSYWFAKSCVNSLYATLYELYPREKLIPLQVYIAENIDTLPDY